MESGSKDWLGRSWIFLLGLALAAAGSFFCWWLWAAWQRARAMDAWLEVPAEVVASGVESYRYNEFSQEEFVPVVRYRYSLAGRAYESSRIRRVPVRSADRQRAEGWLQRYPVGSPVKAYVNPAEPDQSVLKKNSKAALFAMVLPLGFVLAGLRLSWNAIRRRGVVAPRPSSRSIPGGGAQPRA